MARRLREFTRSLDNVMEIKTVADAVTELTIDVEKSNYYKVELSGPITINYVPNFTNELNDYVIELVNGGSYAITWDMTINWIWVDGSQTNIIPVSLNTDGTSDFILLFESDGKLYGKVMR